MARPTQYIGQSELTDVLEHQPRADLTPPEVPEGIDLQTRMTASHLINVIGEAVAIDPSYTTTEDLERVTPRLIYYSLHIKRDDPRFEGAQRLYEGVVFPVSQWNTIALSPNYLAKHTYARTEAANLKKPETEKAADRATLHATASRAAGHAIVAKLVELERLHVKLSDESGELATLDNEIRSGGFSHFNGERINSLRKVGHNAIHEAVEAGAVNTDWGDKQTDGLHRAIRYKLYGLPGHSNQRLGNWRDYVKMARGYTDSRIQAVVTSMHASQAVLEQYIEYLAPEPIEFEGV